MSDPYMQTVGSAWVCLSGWIGIEPTNPTCTQWGFGSNLLGQFFNWAPVLLPVVVIVASVFLVWLYGKVQSWVS